MNEYEAGVLVEWCWQGKIEVLGENLLPVTLQILHGLDCVWAGLFVARRGYLTAWAIGCHQRLHNVSTVTTSCHFWIWLLCCLASSLIHEILILIIIIIITIIVIIIIMGTRWRSWWGHCVTSRKVAVLIPDGETGIFHWRNPSGLWTWGRLSL
jgi:hypothetical protein